MEGLFAISRLLLILSLLLIVELLLLLRLLLSFVNSLLPLRLVACESLNSYVPELVDVSVEVINGVPQISHLLLVWLLLEGHCRVGSLLIFNSRRLTLDAELGPLVERDLNLFHLDYVLGFVGDARQWLLARRLYQCFQLLNHLPVLLLPVNVVVLFDLHDTLELN